MFSTLLPEVILDHIFPFLLINDLLRLRRVCKASKHLTEKYFRAYGTSEKIVRINVDEGENELVTFLALPFTMPVTRFSLIIREKDSSVWGREGMQTFLSLYGEKITHLEVSCLVIPIESSTTVQFFEGLPNLKELKIKVLYSSLESDEDEVAQVKPPLPDLNLPSTFKRLEGLHVTTYEFEVELLRSFMEECSAHLDRINHPYSVVDFWTFQLVPVNLPADMFDCVSKIVKKRHQENPEKPNLKYYDVTQFAKYCFATSARSFYELVTTCSAHGVKLQNVDAEWIEGMMQLDTPDRGLHEHKISKCVVSIKNLTRSVIHLELPFLEEVDILSTSSCSMPEGALEAQPWSNLKELRAYVSWEVEDGDAERVNVSRLFQFFFKEIRRENMEFLDLAFCSVKYKILPYPEITNVCLSCPNLKKLHLTRWPGGDGDIAQLWGNLPLLEDVALTFCPTLTNTAFIGDDVNRPAILKATRLKSLELRGLETMPRITDTLFTVALRHMPLKTLRLRSWNPVPSVTLAGLESLLTGKFAETIEKFPLEGKIMLKGVTDVQLAELERKFRSAQM